MRNPPKTQYATIDDVDIAYQVLGDGPDLVFLPDWYNHLEAQWEEPLSEEFLRSLADVGRLILFDKRGTGLSDPVPLRALPTTEEWAEDLRGVLREVRSEHATLVCASGGSALGLLVAATSPDLVDRLVIIDGSACSRRKPDYPWGAPDHVLETAGSWLASVWGTGDSLQFLAPSLVDKPGVVEWRARLERLAASPGTVRRMQQSVWDLDVRQAMPLVQAKTLVLHRTNDMWSRIGHGRYLADQLPDASFVEIDGGDHLWFGDASEEILEHTLEFLTGTPRPRRSAATLATIVFTDIVDSTATAARLGDLAWQQLLERHDRAAERQVRRWGGDIVGKTGDGLMVRFSGPGQALSCAPGLHEVARSLGLQLRVGAHTGECLATADGLAGVAVHVAARVCEAAGPATTVVTNTVRELSQGSTVTFVDAGDRALKGVDGMWRLYLVQVPST